MTRTVGRPLPFAHYDRRNYETRDVQAGYAGWAEIYDTISYDRYDLDLLVASPWMASTSATRVVDLACGTGRIGAWLRERFPEAVIAGVDLTAEMLDRARDRNVYDSLQQADVCDTGLASKSFDGAITSLAVCHIHDLGGCFAEARRLLRDDGWLVVVDYHPFMLMQGVPSHYTSGDESIAVENAVHAVSDYVALAADNGLTLVEMSERYMDPAWIEVHPSYAKFAGWPLTLMFGYEVTP